MDDGQVQEPQGWPELEGKESRYTLYLILINIDCVNFHSLTSNTLISCKSFDLSWSILICPSNGQIMHQITSISHTYFNIFSFLSHPLNSLILRIDLSWSLPPTDRSWTSDQFDVIVYNVWGFFDVTPEGVTCARRSRAHVTPSGVTSKNPHTLYCLR